MTESNFSRRLDTAFQLVQDGELQSALHLCAALHQESPNHPLVAFLNGAIALKSDRLDDAVECFREAIAHDPSVAEFHKTLGDALVQMTELEAATEAFQNAEQLSPERSDIRYALARCQQRRRWFDQAVVSYDMIEETASEFSDAQLQSAKILHDLDDPQALPRLKQISDRVNAALFAVTRATWELPIIPSSVDHLNESRHDYEYAISQLGDVEGSVTGDDIFKAGTNFFAAYQGAEDRPSQERIAAYYRRICPELNFTAPTLGSNGGEKIAIGFASSNLCNHTVGKLYRGVIANLDRERFDVRVFNGSKVNDEISRFIADNCDRYDVLPSSLSESQQMLAAAGLDILFYPDIGMDPLSYFLAFSRLAPVQVAGWGHPVTTGLETIDYFVSAMDLENDNAELAQSLYTEALWRLRHPPVYLYPPQSVVPSDCPDLSFAEGKTIYCCPQALFKIHPEFDPMFCQILEKDRNGVAVFIEGLPGWSERLRARWQRINADLENRIHFLPHLGQAAFLALLKASHVILDTPHHSGGLSSAEALSMGKAIITWPNTFRLFARTTYGYYRQIGVEDCIAVDAAEYVRIAIRLGTDQAFRSRIEERIAANRHKLIERTEVVDELGDLLAGAVETKEKARGS